MFPAGAPNEFNSFYRAILSVYRDFFKEDDKTYIDSTGNLYKRIKTRLYESGALQVLNFRYPSAAYDGVLSSDLLIEFHLIRIDLRPFFFATRI